MPSSRIIVALDFPEEREALKFIEKISPSTCRLKVGLELFTVAGPSLVGRLVDRGFDVFLDLKFHDIPTTVARACAAASTLGVWMLNVHTLGGVTMMRAAREAVEASRHRPILLGVTVLTSHSDADLAGIGLAGSASTEVPRLAGSARSAGLDGVVCSPHEASRLRAECGPTFVLVTPGVRAATGDKGDQHRTMAAADALREGADYLVIGRPVTRAADPHRALDAIREEIGEG